MVDKNWFALEIDTLREESNILFFDDENQEVLESFRARLRKLTEDTNDKYGIINIWCQDGCLFPYEIEINIGEDETRTVCFENSYQMLYEISLLP